jgi:hypothetical protein
MTHIVGLTPTAYPTLAAIVSRQRLSSLATQVPGQRQSSPALTFLYPPNNNFAVIEIKYILDADTEDIEGDKKTKRTKKAKEINYQRILSRLWTKRL